MFASKKIQCLFYINCSHTFVSVVWDVLHQGNFKDGAFCSAFKRFGLRYNIVLKIFFVSLKLL